MASLDSVQVAFNRGIVSPLALARIDLKRMQLSAQVQNNWMPRMLGSMMLRVGMQYTGATASNNTSRNIPFVRSPTQMARLELTANLLRVWVDDALITRLAVTTAVANGDFNTNLTSWNDNDESGAASVWVAGGYMGLTGTGPNAAIRDQTVTVVAADQGVEHALRIVVQRGPVTLRVGTGTTDDSYINETTLGTGTHSLTFTPSGNFNIRFMSRLMRQVLVTSCNVEAAGVMTLPTPWGASDLDNVRAGADSQSIDVLFSACVGYQQRRIERRGTGSWSIVLYQPNDGPFRNANVGPTTMTSSVLNGNGTLTASAPYFRSSHVGALFSSQSVGQSVTGAFTALNDATAGVEITGVGDGRSLYIVISNLTAVGGGRTVALERTFDGGSTWVAVSGKTWIADTSETYVDGLDNQIVQYRLILSILGAAGTTSAALGSPTGSVRGIARVTAFTSSTVVDVEVLSRFGQVTATDEWEEGAWSDYRGWPTSIAIYESRLATAGYGKVWLSITDQYDSLDSEYEGDAGPISRSIGSGPLDTINWLLPLTRLIMGGGLAEQVVRSNSFDEPLTPTNTNVKPCSTQGSAAVQAAVVDKAGMYAQAGGTRLFEVAEDTNGVNYDSTDLMMLCPELGAAGIMRIAVQRKPDTRVHCVFADGTTGVMIKDRRENVLCWVTVDTEGEVEDVLVLPAAPGEAEDRVYYQVKRTINGAEVRYHEKWALEAECIGGTLNKQADAFITGTNSPASATIALPHLAGEQVVVWFDGKCEEDADGDPQTYTADGAGNVVIGETATNWVAGLAYDARFQSTKLGQALAMMKRVDHVAFVLANTHAKGLKVGPDFDTMDYLPLVYRGAPVDPDRVYTEFDEEGQEFPGGWDPDARICLLAQAPRPATVMATTIKGQMYG